MPENPITVSLPQDLPTDWTYGQTIGPNGTDVGMTQQYGYNYLMSQVNAAQQAAEDLGTAFENLDAESVGAQPAFDILPTEQGGTGATSLGSVTVGNALKLTGLLPSAFMGSAASISSGSLLSWAEAQESSTGLLAGGSEVTDLPVANAFFSGYLLSNSSSTKFLILFRRATAATQNLATIHINTFNLGAWNGWVEINANTWGGYSIWKGTQSQYNALSSKSSTTLYFIVG